MPGPFRDAMTDYLQFVLAPWERMRDRSGGATQFEPAAVNATAIPARLSGFRTLFDGVVSCLRTYSAAELREMTEQLGAADFQWQVGRQRVPRSPGAVTYLIGCPCPGPHA